MPASSIAELKQLIREHLIGVTAVEALVSDRVYGTHLEDADAQTVLTDGPLIVFELISGNLRWHGGVGAQAFELYAYSKRNNAEASIVYDAAVVAMQHECLQITGIDVSAVTRETQRPLDGFNGVLDAWFVRGRWVALTV